MLEMKNPINTHFISYQSHCLVTMCILLCQYFMGGSSCASKFSKPPFITYKKQIYVKSHFI